jgi:Xaa-Pro aminopeptidase
MHDPSPQLAGSVGASPPRLSPELRRQLVDRRIGEIRDVLAERGATAAMLATRATFAWATVGGENHVASNSERGVAGLLVTPQDCRVITAVNEAARIADEEVDGLGIEVESVPWHATSAMGTAARRIAGVDPLDDTALEDAIRPRRSVLAGIETERMAWLAARADAAAGAALSEAAGSTEDRVAAEATRTLAVDGIRTPVLLAAADERIARYRHPLPTDRPVRRRLMLVVVAERWGIHAALTRFAELETPDADLQRRTEAVQRVHDAMVAATLPSATHGDVLDAARAAYAAEGFPDEWTLHHQGGSIGYQGRERIATPGDPTPVVAGMAFAWNPSIGGTKAEETIVLTEDGPRILTR